MQGKTEKAFPHPMPMSQLVLGDPRWTSESHYKPRAHSVGGKGGAGSGRWAPTLGYFSNGGADTSEDLGGRALE